MLMIPVGRLHSIRHIVSRPASTPPPAPKHPSLPTLSLHCTAFSQQLEQRHSLPRIFHIHIPSLNTNPHSSTSRHSTTYHVVPTVPNKHTVSCCHSQLMGALQ